MNNRQPIFEPSPWLLTKMIDRAMHAFDAARSAETKAECFEVGQIVRGRVCGTFVILALLSEHGEPAARVKAVNPDNHAQRARGSLVLPFSALVAL